VKYILGVLGIFVLIVVGFIGYSSNIISTAITKIGSEALGVPVTVASVDMSFLKGEARIQGLTVANPQGFKQEKALSLGEIYVKLDPKSLMSNKIIIEKVLVSAPEIFYEGDLKGSNFKTIQNNLKSQDVVSEKVKNSSPSSSKEAPQESASSSSSKKLQIDSVTIEKAAMHMLARTPAGDKKLNVNLPKVDIQGIGSQEGGASPQEVMQTIVAPFLGQIQSGAVKALKEEGMKRAIDQLKKQGEGVMNKIKGLF
jgi:uncharacterized protein involved in outer membrane biogenesis